MTVVFVYVTTPDREAAARIGRALVNERLAACANIISGMHTIYRWRGNVEEGEEAVLIAKTTQSLVPALTRRVRELHSYEVPCVAALPLLGGNPDYLAWIAAESGPAVG